MEKLSLKDMDVKNKKVLMRVDFNVPLSPTGVITDDTRIKASLPSIQYVLDQGGALILMSHLGRPKKGPAPELSLAPCATRLSELINRPVKMASDCIGEEVQSLAKNLKPGEVLLLENLRFHRAEEHPEEDPAFVEQLASLGDVYVNDAFGTAHRIHASTAVIAHYFPRQAAAGFLMEKELHFLGSTLLHPKHPFYAIIGGAKISTKIGVLEALIQNVDVLMIGGAMAYTFFKAENIPIGNSLYEAEFVEKAKEIVRKCQEKKVKLLLPIDVVIADKIASDAQSRIVPARSGIPDGMEGVSIGPETVKLFEEELQDAATVFWNGPLGVFEEKKFAQATIDIARALARLNCIKIVGGGDSIAAIEAAGVADKMTHLSTGGGASLEFIENKTLPGIEALSARD